MLVEHSVTLTTVTGGAVIGYTPPLNGKLISIRYAKPDSGNYSDGVDFDITGEDTEEDLWADTNINLSETVRPRMALQNNVGVDLTYDTTRKVYESYCLVDERIKIEIANGGDAKAGTFHFLIDQ